MFVTELDLDSLIRKRGGEVKEFDAIYSEYYSAVYKYVLTLCHDKNVAEEITQEAFFKALKNIDKFRGECKLSVWLCQIAKNTFLTLETQNQRRSEQSTDNLEACGDFEQALVNHDTAFAIHKILHTLDEPYKEVFWLRTFGELSFLQIASLFEKTENWARVTYHRAKIKIKEEL
ncbi:RNA polymerase sigma-70 factor, ECF subfamily [Anaerocolumna jejuensis DSM 15929]|uniref:RNA polymerase sigma-70 factor, ECF subfamily n=1 Tax=Anaerocolumna jejuensis DSM 15929 TaxID=1121322 RepID=A0A1M6YY27_9FIRM|nr:RNA polymerase sigma-70 factor, ECF subfamily [Anaerocolumna jejuensis DSM 15929]